MFNNKNKKIYRELLKMQQRRKRGFPIGLILVIIGGVWYAVESGYLTWDTKILYPVAIIIIGALLLLKER